MFDLRGLNHEDTKARRERGTVGAIDVALAIFPSIPILMVRGPRGPGLTHP